MYISPYPHSSLLTKPTTRKGGRGRRREETGVKNQKSRFRINSTVT